MNILSYFLAWHRFFYIWRSWIRASWYNYENNQQDALYKLIYYSKSALYVSGDVFARHLEHWLYLQYQVVFTQVASIFYEISGQNSLRHKTKLQDCVIAWSSPRTGQEGPEGEQMYSSTFPSTSALHEVRGQPHAPGALPQGRPGTHCIGGCGGPWAGQNGCGRYRLHRDSIPVYTRRTIHIAQFQLIRDTSQQQLGWTLPDTVNTVKCSWWWAKTSLTWNNK